MEEEPKQVDSSSDSDDEEKQDEATRKVWEKVNKVFEEYHLSPFAMAAARKWVRLMGNPENKHLARIREWILLRINSKVRAKPTNRWQAGCPDIIPGLRARPLWSVTDQGFDWLQELERNYDVIKNELLELRGASGFQPYRQPTWSTKLAAKDEVHSYRHGEMHIAIPLN
jgi:aspartate beta-hydroxylase